MKSINKAYNIYCSKVIKKAVRVMREKIFSGLFLLVVSFSGFAVEAEWPFLRSSAYDQFYRQEKSFFEEYEKSSVPLSQLGDWGDAVNSSIALGAGISGLTGERVSVVISDSPEFIVEFSETGTFLITTGVLDFIDDSIFALLGESSRRIKDFSREREKLLFPLVAIACSNRTLQLRFSGESYTGFSYSEEDVFKSDILSILIMEASDDIQDPVFLMQNLFEVLDAAHRRGGSGAYDLESYISRTAPFSKRLSNLSANSSLLDRHRALFSLALRNIRLGITLENSVIDMDTLLTAFPGCQYFERLILEGKIKLYYSNLWKDRKPLYPMFAVGTCDGDLEIPEIQMPGDKMTDLYREIVDLGTDYLSRHRDSYILSDLSLIMALSTNPKDRAKALVYGETAAYGEVYDGTISRRINLALVLFFDYFTSGKTEKERLTRAWTIFDEVMNPEENPRDVTFDYSQNGKPVFQQVKSVFIGSTEDVVQDYGGVSKYAGMESRREEVPSASPGKAGNLDYIPVRGIRILDTGDFLLANWGQPSEILYDGFSEIWVYSQLQVSLYLDGGVIVRIEIAGNSPITFPTDLKLGDTREMFEKQYGNPFKRDYDFDVYSPQGHNVYVQFLSEKIRKIILVK